MPSEKEKMLAGELYWGADPELREERLKTRMLLHRLNVTEYKDPEKYKEIIAELFPNCPGTLQIEPPFYCDYGYNIHAGEYAYFNFNCVVLDVCPVHIGDNVQFGPGVHIYAATHPKDYLERRGPELGKPVSIGDDCWIGGGAIILPGVTIGKRSIIGAGLVVSKDVPDDTVFTGKQ
ncbi:MAG: sugar O-acetyltransferase [Dehalococcoidales bacterium]|nr:sugar O-acetyltransferase [Dehalococcoidales bacterium]